MYMEQRFRTRCLGASADRSGAAHSSSAAEACVVSEKKVPTNIDCQDINLVARVRSHDVGCREDGLAFVKGTAI